MGKARYYGIATKQAIDSRNTASPKFKVEDELTRPMIDGAIVALTIQNPNFDNLTAQHAAQQVKTYLKERGFRGDLSTPGGKISDGSNTYSLTHANNDKGQIVVGQETHHKLEDEKKRKKK